MSVCIRIKDAVKKYGDNTIISDLSLNIKEGEFFTLLGPSGCGKTTLLRMIAGFNSIEGGDFYFNDKRINDIDPSKRNIGMVFQNYAIFPHMTVLENLTLAPIQVLGMDKAAAEQRAMELLARVEVVLRRGHKLAVFHVTVTDESGALLTDGVVDMFRITP